ncbi:MAG TPA: hypothetical protein VFW11_23635 [Cyclobacteriaceae bacterium]|nr:hypothetical protein [Cyclobacteriaceae bacterium]
MPSLVPGFEYDIFITYRHKDNMYDGWVSELYPVGKANWTLPSRTRYPFASV